MNRRPLSYTLVGCAAVVWASLAAAQAGTTGTSDTTDTPTEEVLRALGELPRQRGVLALQRALDQGLPSRAAVTAIEALGRQGGQQAMLTLRAFTTHRVPEVRRGALLALTMAAGSGATPELQRGLGDSAASVREACATGLSEVGTVESAPRLLAALDAGNRNAASAYGRLAPKNALQPALGARLQRLPWNVIWNAYAAALHRTDVPIEVKTSLLHQLREQGTPAARSRLSALKKRPAIAGDPALAAAIRQTIKRLPRVLTRGSLTPASKDKKP